MCIRDRIVQPEFGPSSSDLHNRPCTVRRDRHVLVIAVRQRERFQLTVTVDPHESRRIEAAPARNIGHRACARHRVVARSFDTRFVRTFGHRNRHRPAEISVWWPPVHCKQFTETNIEQHARCRYVARSITTLYQHMMLRGADLLDSNVVFVVARPCPDCEQQHVGTRNDVWPATVSYTHLRAHETPEHLVCRLLLEKKNGYYRAPAAGLKVCALIFGGFFFNDTATTEIYTRSLVGSVRCV